MYKNYLVTVELNSGHVGLHILVNKAPSDELSRQTSLGNLSRKYLNLVSFSLLNGNICLSEALANVLVISLWLFKQPVNFPGIIIQGSLAKFSASPTFYLQKDVCTFICCYF